MNRVPNSVTAAFVIILVIAVFWFIFALVTALGMNWSLEKTGSFKWVMVALAFGTPILLAGLALLTKKQNRLAYYLILALLTLIALATFTDQIGWIDLSALLVTLSALILLIKDRHWYLTSITPEKTEGAQKTVHS